MRLQLHPAERRSGEVGLGPRSSTSIRPRRPGAETRHSVKGFGSRRRTCCRLASPTHAPGSAACASPTWSTNPAALQKFQAAQSELTAAWGGLLVVTENYPQLKSDAVVPRSGGAAGRHREPHRGGAQPLHQGGAGLQRRHPHLTNTSRRSVGFKEKANFTWRTRSGSPPAPKVDFNAPARRAREIAARCVLEGDDRVRQAVVVVVLCWACRRGRSCARRVRFAASQGSWSTRRDAEHDRAAALDKGSRTSRPQGQPDRGVIVRPQPETSSSSRGVVEQ